MQPITSRRHLWVVPFLLWTTAHGAPAVREIAWEEVVPALHAPLKQRGIEPASFPTYVSDLRRRNAARVREGDLDHLVHYLLQSTSFTRLPPVEPAISAREFVGGGRIVPRHARERIDAFVTAAQRNTSDVRFQYFREMLSRERPAAQSARTFVSEHYTRAMTFLHEKEFARPNPSLYQERGLSTDTSVDAGYVVYLALATLKQLEPGRRIERALIVGPGLDLAPRTGLVEAGPPQSFQSLAVMDALIGLGLSDPGTIEVRAVDINPRVVAWIRGVRGKTPRLAVTAGVAETGSVHLSDDYRSYLERFGRSIGRAQAAKVLPSSHLTKSIDVSAGVTQEIDATGVDITVERLDERYDLVVATNVFPYLSDADLILALVNIQRMLAPNGVLLHNEARPILADATLALDLRLIHARSAILATVKGASPLYDAIWMHRR